MGGLTGPMPAALQPQPDPAGAHGRPQDHTPVGPAASGSAPAPWGSRQSLEKRVCSPCPAPLMRVGGTADVCRARDEGG